MTKRKLKYVEVSFHSYEIPSVPDAFIEWLNNKLDEQPVNRDQITIDIGAEEDYGSCSVYLSLCYNRPEDDKDRAERREAEERRKEWDRKQYERLKAQFGEK